MANNANKTDTSTSEKNVARAEPDYDVVVIGAGVAGSMIAACLAKNAVSVLVVDADQHPRFAVGESTNPYTSTMMRLISERYGVPEIKMLTTFEGVQEEVSSNSGVERNFGFLYHSPGQPQNHQQANEFPIPKSTHTANHLFRQDIDAWMLNVALRYGAQARQNTRIADLEIDDAGVTLIPARGEPIRAKYLIDASGSSSPLAAKLGLREEPTRLRTHSRSLFTHMVHVDHYEDTVTPRRAHKNPSPWSQGTLHHLFPGGWVWVIPFDNHAKATSSLCSVGLNLDPRVYPKPAGTGEQEFAEFLGNFPDIANQFRNARPVREWVSTERLQYSSRQTIGYRWCLTSQAAGFVDALFSRGLDSTMEVINSLVCRVIDAVGDDDFSVERFEYVERLEQGLLDYNDDLVANAYTSFQNWDLWDAWFRVWSLAQILAMFEINRAYAKYVNWRDLAALAHLAELELHGSVPDYAPARELFRNVSELMQQVQNGTLDARTAAEHIFKLLGAVNFSPPAFGLTDRDNRWYNATMPSMIKTLRWAKREAPPEIGQIIHEGLAMSLRKRFSPAESSLRGELTHALAEVPVIGRRLRVPTPR